MESGRKTILLATLVGSLALLGGGPAVGYEKPTYETVEEDGDIELRRYEPYVVAETYAGGEYDRAMDEAFMRLFRYISGKNRKRVEPDAEKIAMTAPVTMAKVGDEWRMAFMVPGRYSLETAPPPADPQVRLREEPGGLVAALTYSGRWSRERYLKRQELLEQWIDERGLEAAGEPMFAGYDAPYVPWFLRRNEVLIPLAEGSGATAPTAATR